MTSDEIKKVREAATLLLRWHVGGIESDESHPWDGMDYDDLNYEKAEAIKVVCGFARSLVGTDGELPVTAEWMPIPQPPQAQESKSITVSREEYEWFVSQCNKPGEEPSEKLKKLVEEYKRTVTSLPDKESESVK